MPLRDAFNPQTWKKLYTMQDVESCLSRVQAVGFNEKRVSVTFISVEPRCEKIGLLDFRPGQTQIGCTATEDGWRLEISDLVRRGIVLFM